MIVMDLEWNRSYDKKKLDEILQIGAVRVERPGGPIVSTFCAFVRPCVHKRFDPGAKKLPDLQCAIDSQLTFAEAWAAFTAWCGEDREFAFWGPDDFGVMRQNCAFWDVPCLEPERVYKFQRAFAHAYGAEKTMMALWRVVDYLGIPDVFDFHNALYDALYTALVGEWLRREDLEFEPKKRVKPVRRRKRSAPPQKPADAAAEPKKTVRRRRRRRRRTRRREDANTAPKSESAAEGS